MSGAQKLGDGVQAALVAREGLSSGTWIDTPLGYRPIEALQPGDQVISFGEGLAEVRSTLAFTKNYSEQDTARPIHIAPQAFGPDMPERSTIIGPNAQVAPQVPLDTNIASDFVERLGVRQMATRRKVHWYLVVLDGGGWLRANGLWVSCLTDARSAEPRGDSKVEAA